MTKRALASFVFACSFSLLASCSGKKKDEATEAPASEPTSAALDEKGPEKEEDNRPAQEVAARKLPPIPQSEVEAVLNAWLKAQNDGEFESYQSLYATRFTGVKRVGERASTYNRESWLKDRKRMFRKPMVVTQSDVEVTSSHASAQVKFVQGFQSGKFSDKGPKKILLVREGGKLLIAREEMLASIVAGEERVDSDGVMLPAPDSGGLYLGPSIDLPGILDSDNKPSSKRLTLDGMDPYLATLRLKKSELPDELQGMLGRKVYVVDGDTICEDNIESIDLTVGVTPHFGELQILREDDPDADFEAEHIFGMADPSLLARLGGSCGDGPAWFDKPKAKSVLARSDMKNVDKEALEKKFESLSASKELQESFESEAGKGEKWHADGHMKFSAFVREGRTIVVMGVQAGNGCGEFEGSLTGIFEIDAQGKIVSLGSLEIVFEAESAILGTDGVEFFGSSGHITEESVHLAPAGDSYDVVDSFAWDYQDCPC